MHKSSSLYNLIAMLNKQEKRYFKLYASKNSKKGENNYIKLFDAIVQQKQSRSSEDPYLSGRQASFGPTKSKDSVFHRSG